MKTSTISCPRCNRNFSFPESRLRGKGAYVACPHCEFKLSQVPTKPAAAGSGIWKVLLLVGASVGIGFAMAALYYNSGGAAPDPAMAVPKKIDVDLHRDLISLGHEHVENALPSRAVQRFVEGTNPILLIETNDEGKIYVLFGKYIGNNLKGASGSWRYQVTVCAKPRGEIETLEFDIDGQPAEFK